jgi:hypothetical protein
MHVGRCIHRHDYHMEGQHLAKVTDENILEIVSSDLKHIKQCTTPAIKASPIDSWGDANRFRHDSQCSKPLQR